MKNNEKFKDKRGREWEKFCDVSYYDLYCVRCLVAPKEFDSHLSFHFMNMSEADDFQRLIEASR